MFAPKVKREDFENDAKDAGEVGAGTDVVIATASIPGKKAPIIITKEMVGRMKYGALIVDMAAETGGADHFEADRVGSRRLRKRHKRLGRREHPPEPGLEQQPGDNFGSHHGHTGPFPSKARRVYETRIPSTLLCISTQAIPPICLF